MHARSNYAHDDRYDTEGDAIDVPLDGYEPASAHHSGYAPAAQAYAPPSGYAPATARAPISGYAPAAPPAAPSHLDEPAWLVHVEGGNVVGPVSASQIARGIRAGRVPTEASIQRPGDVFWSGVLDESDVIAALKST